MRIAPLAMALCLAACGDSAPDIRALPQTQAAEPSPLDRAYQAGKSHLMADRAGLAIVMFEQALARDPLSVAGLNGLGAAYDQLNRPEVARLYYLKALALEPDGADTLNNMAISAAMAGDTQTARDLLGRAADLAPANATIRGNLLIANMTPRDRLPSPSVPDTDGPQLERSGLMEVTLTIPLPASARHDPLRPTDIGDANSLPAIVIADRPVSIRTGVAVAAVTGHALRIEQVSPDDVRHLIPTDGPPTRAAIQLAALAGGAFDRAGLLPHAPRGGKVTSEALAPLPIARPASDGQTDSAIAPVDTGNSPAVPAPAAPDPAGTAGRPSCVIEVSNGAGRNHLADRVRRYLVDHGALVGRLTNAVNFDNAQTILFHRPDGEAEARRLSALFPLGITLQADPGLACAIRLQLGRDFLRFDQSLSNGEL
jgi:tetratricopeptide (TPR) repeat protein